MSTELVDPMASVRAYLEAADSAATHRAYSTDWADFSTWCDRQNFASLPAAPIAVAQYLAQRADGGTKPSTLKRRVAAIAYVHRKAGHESPTNADGVKAVMRGIRRKRGSRPVRKAPATADLFTSLLEHLPAGLAALRDRALLLVGFGAALRRSELVALDVPDVDIREKGMIVEIRRSKTDQEGAGALVPVPRGNAMKPVDALEAWLKASGITEGPIFRKIDRHGNLGTGRLSDRSVARIVKRIVAATGINPDAYSGHSLRAGFVTSSLDNKVDLFKIMGVSRHVKVDTLKIYDRREFGFDDAAGEGFL
jgi:site-specific recombinase XerD